LEQNKDGVTGFFEPGFVSIFKKIAWRAHVPERAADGAIVVTSQFEQGAKQLWRKIGDMVMTIQVVRGTACNLDKMFNLGLPLYLNILNVDFIHILDEVDPGWELTRVAYPDKGRYFLG
jgi:hypothetical protein